MLDLEAGVHLDKVELSVRVDELHGPGTLVTQGADQIGRGRHQTVPHVLWQARRGRFLDELLVAALDGAVPLGEGDRLTMRVSEDLYLHVPEPFEVLLDVDRAVAEVGRCLPARAEVGGLDLGLGLDHPHPLAPAAGARLDDQRVADLGADALDLLHALAMAFGARGHGDARFGRGLAGLGFVAHPGDGARVWADELQADPLADLGEAGVLGEETVAGVGGVGARKLSGGDDRRYVQVAAHRRRRADTERLLGQYLDDLPRDVGDDLVHQLHRLDDAKGLSGADRIPHLDIDVLTGSRRSVEGPDHGRAHSVQTVHLGRVLRLASLGNALGPRCGLVGRRRGWNLGSGPDRDLRLPLADPDLTHPALAHELD